MELLRKKRAKNYGKRWLGLVLSHFVYSFRPPIIPFQVQGFLRGLTTNLKPSNDFKAKIPEAFPVAGGHPINGVHKRLFPHWTKIRIASDRMTSPKKQQLGWNSNSTIRTVYFYRLLSMLLLWGNLSERHSCWLKFWLPGFESVSPSQVVGWRRTDGRVILCTLYHFSTSHLTHDGFFCFGTYCTHVQTCNNVRVQSATEWSASVHTAHMSKPVITFVFKVLRNGMLR